ncbi:hypothetical protein BZK31_26270 [Pseudomonas floridensis]|uniref:Uncharacterized protein n=1 Tax=Pseudomonas floridensis TaxID=1958950 RepID=A0A1X0N056_9PSED|nr:hypothetical protein BZK31_26270 [Pseudomonas floridensis]
MNLPTARHVVLLRARCLAAGGRVAGGWLSRYIVHCSLEIPVDEQESFAGAVSCFIADNGAVRDISGPMFMDTLCTQA